MASLKDISLADLAKNSKNYGFVKSGVNKDKGEGFTDPFTLGVAYPIEVTDEAVTTHPSKGYQQLEASVSIIKDDGTLQKAGKVWLDLPLPTEEEAVEMGAVDEAVAALETRLSESNLTAEEEATLEDAIDTLVFDSPAYKRMNKAGDRFLKFLRAVAPEQFTVIAEIDKSNPKKWVYLDFAGNKMSDKVREARAAEVAKAVVGMAEGLRDGTQSVKGAQCFLKKKANPNSPKYPYINFSSAKS